MMRPMTSPSESAGLDRRLALLLLSTPGIGPRTLLRMMLDPELRLADLKTFMGWGAGVWTSRFHLTPKSVQALESKKVDVDALTEELDRREIRTLAVHDSEYPNRLREVLGDQAPPVLFAWGNLALTERPAVAACGSRDASADGLAFASRFAEEAANRRFNVVSGYARGIDMAAHQAALASGGTTTIVLAEGILGFRPKVEVQDMVNPEACLVLSEFPPRLPWTIGNAMARNRTICALADVAVVIEPRGKGGTFEAGRTCVQLGVPAWVKAGKTKSEAGWTELVAQGLKLVIEDSTGKPDTDPLFEAAAARKATPKPGSRQGSLFAGRP